MNLAKPVSLVLSGSVRNLKGTVSATSVVITWDPPLDEDGLLASYFLNFVGQIITLLSPTTTSYTVENLTPSTLYNIIMHARNNEPKLSFKSLP